MCKHVHVVQTTLTSSSINLTHSESQVKDTSPIDNQILDVVQDIDLYEDLVFLANNNSPEAEESEESNPDSTEYFA